MTTTRQPLNRFLNFLVLFACLGISTLVRSQTCNPTCPGDNAVYQGSAQQQSHSFIDAAQIVGTNNQTDICNKINAALMQLHNATPGSGLIYGREGVIDARGVTNLDCAASSSPISPWANFSYSGTVPPDNTVLLPAGIIQVSVPWTLPARTRLIGQGSCLGSNCSTSMLTTIQACTSSTQGCGVASFGTGPILQMGSLSACPANCCNPPCGQNQLTGYNCNGVSIEHLRLDGNGVASGIENAFAEELSYVSDIAMVNLAGTGLALKSFNQNNVRHNANNSGPYSNLVISGTGQCVNINGTSGTRGVHGLSCVSTAQTAQAAIYLDGSNNTLEDVSIYAASGSGFTDGILLGSQATTVATANSNLLFNITGDTNVENLIHICGQPSNGNCPANSNNSTLPTDVTIMGVTRSTGGSSAASIQDDLTGALATPTLTDAHVGVYLIGEPVVAVSNSITTVLGYSRFTTSLSVPTWLVGASSPSSSCPAQGDLYSNTSSSSDTLWGCVGTSWASIK